MRIWKLFYLQWVLLSDYHLCDVRLIKIIVTAKIICMGLLYFSRVRWMSVVNVSGMNCILSFLCSVFVS